MTAWGVLALRPACLLGSVASLLVTLAPSPAEACGACGCDAPSGIRPQLANELAPMNARFLLALHHVDGYGNESTIDPEAVSWTDADGNEVEFDVVPTDGAYDEVWLVPRELLKDSTEYRIAADYGGEYPLENVFSTDTYEDNSHYGGPPAVAEPITSSPACGAFHGARLTWEEPVDDAEDMGYRPIVELEVESGDETAVIFADAIKLYPGDAVDLAIPGSEESANCWGTLALPLEPSDEPVTVTGKLYDWAGNIRHFDPVEVTLGEVPGASCPGDGSDGSSDGDAQRGGGTCAVTGPMDAEPTNLGWWLLILAAGMGRSVANRRIPKPNRSLSRS
jgi:hypothetical protein